MDRQDTRAWSCAVSFGMLLLIVGCPFEPPIIPADPCEDPAFEGVEEIRNVAYAEPAVQHSVYEVVEEPSQFFFPYAIFGFFNGEE